MQTTTDTHTDIAPVSSSATPVRVTLVIGSNRTGRFGPVIAEWLLGRVRRHDGFEVDVVDVAEADLPTTFATTPESTARLAEITPKLAAAEAFIVLTPEYNHSYPAALKNLIDWHFHEWRAKPVALVSYGGMSGGLRATEHLRQVFAELHATTVRDTVSFHQAHTAFDETGHLKDPSAPNSAAHAMLDQLSWWAHALREAKKSRPYGS
ncbi:MULTISPECIES: NADPH-dependent FMN reductase [Streptomyces]|uniref:NAD(P)H-dependent FMN reductase n=1 Tax=Streptomyces stelliscabiei TaxID=146820 RepID=A0A8I0P6D6_9ACTN|nr:MULTISPECIES: NAD(P)H-dependent oxidoreductase [Streptomyces]KND45217.1 FMN reductase [Streptomyces stelliscabiei]MBE1597031.1 NAD(P)H-dependent FMN reductase [Streptomyces stelliscabiei]MDX2514000.1 NAD(P)H-dependent oxidoreductase [Streptomyces stelliscabiei]MDX2557357.1 NAD(P)H-dependent oxidoreductase [Streptomyces stelliscabiei]MDX2616989.1 NAD(P)H-dependent oxidoreductase [Streptomyces stelliscabiei]